MKKAEMFKISLNKIRRATGSFDYIFVEHNFKKTHKFIQFMLKLMLPRAYLCEFTDIA